MAEKKQEKSNPLALPLTVGAIKATEFGIHEAIKRPNDYQSLEETHKYYKDKLKPGDLLISKNTVIPGKSHAAIVGHDKRIYSVGNAQVNTVSITSKGKLYNPTLRDYIQSDSNEGKYFNKAQARGIIAEVHRPNKKVDLNKLKKTLTYLKAKGESGKFTYDFFNPTFDKCNIRGNCTTSIDEVYKRVGLKDKNTAYAKLPSSLINRDFTKVLETKVPHPPTISTPALALGLVGAKMMKSEDSDKKRRGAALVTGGAALQFIPKVKEVTQGATGSLSVWLGNRMWNVAEKLKPELANQLYTNRRARYLGGITLGVPALAALSSLSSDASSKKK